MQKTCKLCKNTYDISAFEYYDYDVKIEKTSIICMGCRNMQKEPQNKHEWIIGKGQGRNKCRKYDKTGRWWGVKEDEYGIDQLNEPRIEPQSWEEEFNDKFTSKKIFNNFYFTPKAMEDDLPIKIKAFISTILADQKKEIIEKIEGMKRIQYAPFEEDTRSYNQSLEDIIKAIK